MGKRDRRDFRQFTFTSKNEGIDLPSDQTGMIVECFEFRLSLFMSTYLDWDKLMGKYAIGSVLASFPC
jgi:hypothetical protein